MAKKRAPAKAARPAHTILDEGHYFTRKPRKPGLIAKVVRLIDEEGLSYGRAALKLGVNRDALIKLYKRAKENAENPKPTGKIVRTTVVDHVTGAVTNIDYVTGAVTVITPPS
jgi:hypothetical protein